MRHSARTYDRNIWKERPCGVQEGVMVGYRYYDTKKTDVLFPFGHGLSYTAFTYNDLEIIRQQENGRQTVKVSCSVTNTGEHEEGRTVQIYVAPEQKKDRPVHELKALKKSGLMPGKQRGSVLFWRKEIFPVMTQTKRCRFR